MWHHIFLRRAQRKTQIHPVKKTVLVDLYVHAVLSVCSICTVFFVNVCVSERERGLCIFGVFDLWSVQHKHGVFQQRNEATLLHKTPRSFYPSMHWASRRSVPSLITFLHSSLFSSSSVFIYFEELDLQLFTSLHCEDLRFNVLWTCFAIMAESILKLC